MIFFYIQYVDIKQGNDSKAETDDKVIVTSALL